MEQLFSAIPSVLDGLGHTDEIEEAVVFAAWSRCAGKLVRERTAPVEFLEKRLVIAVQDLTWRRHLEDLSPQMLARINRLLGQGKIKFIEFRVDESAVNAARGLSNTGSITKIPVARISPSLAAAAKAITDEKLREQFLSAAAGYLAKQGNS
jgi:hypothetical protein